MIWSLLLVLAHATPRWAETNTIHLDGHVLTAVCSGSGPSLSLARQSAISSCQATAEQYTAHEVKVSSLSVESENSVGVHQEVENSGTFKNLTCEPKRDQFEVSDGEYSYWVKCRFDLSKVQATATEPTTPNAPKFDGELTSVEPDRIPSMTDGRVMVVESIPPCNSIIVQGPMARDISCHHNPMRVVVYPTDKSMIVRAKGYVPKAVPLNVKGTRDVQVMLEND